MHNLKRVFGERTNLAEQYPRKVKQLDEMRKQWDSKLIEPRFLGLIHTPKWQAKAKRKKHAKTRDSAAGTDQ